MTTLAELQARFHAFLLGRGRGIEDFTVGTARRPAGARLAVYANAYRLRLQEVLADDFPGLKALLGEAGFERLAGAYIDACPSNHPSVRWFGRFLADFLQDHAAGRDRPGLAEMAAFEWAQGEVLDAADSPCVAVEALGAVPPAAWPGMRLAFQHARRRLDLWWNVPPVWQELRAGGEPSCLERGETAVAWLLWRRDLMVHWRSLEEDERYAIDAAASGVTFGEICEGLLARTGDDQVPLRAAGFLKRWAHDQLISRIDA